MEVEDQKILEKFITLIAEHPDKTIAGTEGTQKSLDIVIYPEFDPKNIMVKPKAHGVFVTLKEDTVDVTLMEKTALSPRSWATTDVPYQRILMKGEDEALFGRFYQLYDDVTKAQAKIREEKTARVIQDIIDNKFSFDNPMELLLKELRVPNSEIPGMLIEQPQILNDEIDDMLDDGEEM